MCSDPANRAAPSLRVRSDALLLLAALLWGSAFIPQRLAAQAGLGACLFNGLRFLLGAVILLPAVRFFQASRSATRGIPAATPDMERHLVGSIGSSPSKGFLPWALIAGTLLVGASVLQQAGMKYTTAGSAGFLTGLYVVLVPIVMFAGWGERLGWQSWAGALLATVGVFLLGVDDHFRIEPGDALELLGAVLWALHVVIVGRAVQQVEVLHFSVGQYLVAGTLSVLLGLIFEAGSLPLLANCWWTVVYVGVVSVAIAYTLQSLGQKHAPAADAAIILSMEAVFAAFFGYLLLGEVFLARQLFGCILILAAVAVVQLKGWKFGDAV